MSKGQLHRRRDRQHVWRWQRRLLLALVGGFGLLLFMFLPIWPGSRLIPGVSAHALPVRSDPPANAILRVPPAQVRIWFDDELVPATSHIIVETAQGQEVDRRDSKVSRADPHEMMVSLPRLPAGTYTVLWVAQSTDDGHVTEGSFVFSIAQPNGTVPGLPAGHAPGSSTPLSSNTALDGPTILQLLATWLALLCMTFWVGGLIWETWILSPGGEHDPDLEAGATLAVHRFRRLAPCLLGGFLLADIALVMSQGAELAGSWAGAFSPEVWQAILLSSHFGLFWMMRQVVALVALGLTIGIIRRGWALWRMIPSNRGAFIEREPQLIPDWWHAVLLAFRRIPHLPARMMAGWRRRSWLGRGELALGAALLVAFALSGHAAAVPSWELGYSLAVDLLHLLGSAAWVGGLLYIGFVLLPVLYRLNERQHARVFALGLPQYSALAVISVLVLVITGPLNASIHLTSLQELLTTFYGRVLVVKSEFFLLMAAMSAYHAFSLRPRLARELAQPKHAATKMPAYTLAKPAPAGTTDPTEREDVQENEGISEQAWHLAERMETWLRREAMLGVGVLLCVALLSVFAGTLVPS